MVNAKYYKSVRLNTRIYLKHNTRLKINAKGR